jgi:prevent-host-death family protein
LRELAAERILTVVSTVSLTELKRKPSSYWLKSDGRRDLVVTSKGKPVAVLLRLSASSGQSAEALLRSIRALQAQAALQQASIANGTSDLSMRDIDAEIAAARRARRRK